MYPHPELNSFLQGINPHVPKKILNNVVDKAMYARTTRSEFKPHWMRLASTQPQCYSPDVDVSRAKCGFRQFALPKLKRELKNKDPLTVRQAVTTLGDQLVDPEKLIQAVKLKISDRLAEFLISDDPYLRERTAMIYVTMANQAAGREAILKNLTVLANLSKGLEDHLAAVRLKIAQAVEMLARDYYAAHQLNACGFAESIITKLSIEQSDVLLVHLDTLGYLFLGNIKKKAIKAGAIEKLIELLKREDELLLCKVLFCLGILCEDIEGKEKSIELDLLCYLKKLLLDERESVKVEAAQVASFITITTQGKLQALELDITRTLLHLLLNKCNSGKLLLPIIKTLTNIAEAPKGRKILLDKCLSLLEDLNLGDNQVLLKHRDTLLDVIRWRP